VGAYGGSKAAERTSRKKLMRIKSVELSNFKRFTHLVVDGLPDTTKLIVLVGSNGSGKTSFFEAFNHFYKYSGYQNVGDYHYYLKAENDIKLEDTRWFEQAQKLVNIVFYDTEFPNIVGKSNVRGHFYFRTAYRNEPDFSIRAMQQQNEPTSSARLETLIQNDLTVSANYERLIAHTISGVFDTANNNKSVENLREELTGKIRKALARVFNDLSLFSLGEPLNNGSFYFKKGTIGNFHYRNLSAGEKAAFDLILDMVIQSKYYKDAVYCIDEPEAHMHTTLQGKVLRELYLLVPEHSQLWVSTHSIGMLQEAEEIEKELPGTVVFLDFDGRDFDADEIIKPAKISKAVMEKFYELAFGDFAKLMLPRKIVFCEGDPNGKSRKDFDKTIFTKIFGDEHPDTFFVSAKSCSELENIETSLGEILTRLLNNTEIIKVVDRDDRSKTEIAELNVKGIRVLSRRNLESYLLDDSIISLLCNMCGVPEKSDECLAAKQTAINNSIKQNHAPDDIKSARGEIYNAIKRILGLTQCGNNADAFIRDTMAPLIKPETEIYKQLEREIFRNGNQTNG
jgi:predicted ATPase